MFLAGDETSSEKTHLAGTQKPALDEVQCQGSQVNHGNQPCLPIHLFQNPLGKHHDHLGNKSSRSTTTNSGATVMPLQWGGGAPLLYIRALRPEGERHTVRAAEDCLGCSSLCLRTPCQDALLETPFHGAQPRQSLENKQLHFLEIVRPE